MSIIRSIVGCAVSRSLAGVTLIVVSQVSLLTVTSALAADTLINSFEADLEGFTNNGNGITVTQDTIGATEGSKSMKVAMTGPTFVGAQTAVLNPAFGDPPGLEYIKFDLTVTQRFGELATPQYSGFAVVGVTVFGVSQTGTPSDMQTGPSDDPLLEFHIDGLEPGTYRDLVIDLTRLTHPITFETASFNDIVGTAGSGDNDIIPTGFQFYFNKTGGLSYPLTVYIDNVRVGNFASLVEGDYSGNGVVDAADYTVWRDNLGLLDVATVADGDGDGDGDVTQADYDFWKTRFGTGAGSGSLGAGVVPEPHSLMLLLAGLGCGVARRSQRRYSRQDGSLRTA